MSVWQLFFIKITNFIAKLTTFFALHSSAKKNKKEAFQTKAPLVKIKSNNLRIVDLNYYSFQAIPLPNQPDDSKANRYRQSDATASVSWVQSKNTPRLKRPTKSRIYKGELSLSIILSKLFLATVPVQLLEV